MKFKLKITFTPDDHDLDRKRIIKHVTADSMRQAVEQVLTEVLPEKDGFNTHFESTFYGLDTADALDQFDVMLAEEEGNTEVEGGPVESVSWKFFENDGEFDAELTVQ